MPSRRSDVDYGEPLATGVGDSDGDGKLAVAFLWQGRAHNWESAYWRDTRQLQDRLRQGSPLLKSQEPSLPDVRRGADVFDLAHNECRPSARLFLYQSLDSIFPTLNRSLSRNDNMLPETDALHQAVFELQLTVQDSIPDTHRILLHGDIFVRTCWLLQMSRPYGINNPASEKPYPTDPNTP
jgi:hypothetical protein